MVERNAVIDLATISRDDHGLLSAWLMLDYGGSGQGFGGYALYLPREWKHAPGQPNFAGHFIWRVMEVTDVTEWSRLVGRTIRVRATDGGIRAIGHIVKNEWFDPTSEFNEVMGRR
jgi:hypothetical protein